MHVVINATVTSQREKTGIAVFTENLIKAMCEQERDNIYDVFTLQSPVLKKPSEQILKVHSLPVIFSKLPAKLSWACWYAWYYTAFNMQLDRMKPDVYLSFDFTVPGYHRCPAICMIYDLTPLLFPETYPEHFRIRFGKQVAHAVKNTERLVTISQAVKKDIQKYYNVGPEKIDVIYPGYDEKKFTVEGDKNVDKAVLSRLGIKLPYVLFLGTMEKKKNIPRLIEAYNIVRENSSIIHKLVLGGKRDWNDSDIFESITHSPVAEDINYIGYVPHDDLPSVMRNADLFVFPSLNEGFGRPPLEAMACGVPVITSRVSALPEVVGDAGILIDPYNVDEIAQAIVNVLSNRELRQNMVRKGLDQARLFSWRKAAADMLSILSSVSGR